jgi:1-acyl-sn-glycerol-3-phosphate acyltransferase
VSWLDAFIVVWLMAPSGVAKEYNAHLPVLKHAVRALQTVYIPSSKGRKQNSASKQGDRHKQQDEHEGPQQQQQNDDEKPVNAFIVKQSVTEVLQRRVNDPTYCALGGYPMVVMAPEGTCGNGRSVFVLFVG